jgi:phage shock protein A
MRFLDRLRGRQRTVAPGDELAHLEAAYLGGLDALQGVRRDVVEAITARKRLEVEADRLRAGKAKLESDAASRAAAGDEDAARDLLRRALDVERRHADLLATIASLREQGAELERSSERLHDAMESFRLDIERLRARQVAADAHDRAWATERALAAELDEASRRARRVADTTAALEAHAGAIADAAAEPEGRQR